jgi:putative ABC transport system substrate-binding protein
VDLIVASGTPAVEAARTLTRKIPIVMASVGDAVGSGFVANLAHPGGNITGMSLNLPGSAARQIEWIRQLVPGVSRATFLTSARDSAGRLLAEATERAGGRLGIRVQILSIDSAADLSGGFATMRREQAGVLIIQPFVPEGLDRIVELANRSRLPSVSWSRDFAEAGVLMTYGPDQREIWRHAAIYVDRILRGAKPRDLAVTEPTKHLLTVNLKTAKILGLTVPPAVLSRADEVIQ